VNIPDEDEDENEDDNEQDDENKPKYSVKNLQKEYISKMKALQKEYK
jgi:hypothetical protein